MTDHRTLEPASGPFKAGVNIPGDKSLSHRALIFAALADGESEITGLAPGFDVGSTLRALKRLGLRSRRRSLHARRQRQLIRASRLTAETRAQRCAFLQGACRRCRSG